MPPQVLQGGFIKKGPGGGRAGGGVARGCLKMCCALDAVPAGPSLLFDLGFPCQVRPLLKAVLAAASCKRHLLHCNIYISQLLYQCPESKRFPMFWIIQPDPWVFGMLLIRMHLSAPCKCCPVPQTRSLRLTGLVSFTEQMTKPVGQATLTSMIFLNATS